MIKNIQYFLIAFAILLLANCKSDTKNANSQEVIKSPEELYGTWKLNKIDTLYGQSNEELVKMTQKHARNGLLINFFPENILTRIEGQKYTSTTWNFNGIKSAVTVGDVVDGRAEKFDFGFDKIRSYMANENENLLVENDKGVFHFKKVSDVLSNVKDDPFHPVNNQWRVIAPKSETYKQMMERLLNYTEHNYTLFKSTKERGGEKVVNANSIGIFVYYDGAIGLVDGGKVPTSWMANYYSPDEAMDAYAFMSDYFKGGFIRKKDPGGFVASGEVIFKELIEKLKVNIAKK